MEQIEDPLEPAAEIVRRCEQKQLMALYKVGAFTGAEDLLRQIAKARGKLKAGGVPVLEVRATSGETQCVRQLHGVLWGACNLGHHRLPCCARFGAPPLLGGSAWSGRTAGTCMATG